LHIPYDISKYDNFQTALKNKKTAKIAVKMMRGICDVPQIPYALYFIPLGNSHIVANKEPPQDDASFLLINF